MKRLGVADRLRLAVDGFMGSQLQRRHDKGGHRTHRRRQQLKLETLEARCLLSGTPISNDADTALLLRFDGGLLGVSGESAIADVGVAYETGIVNQAVHTGAPGYVRYDLTDNINAPAGTVEFWIKPDWNGNLNANHIFFEAGDNFNNGMLLGIDGANNLRFIQWGDDPNTPGVETSVERGIGVSGSDWLADEWHHIAATWDSAAEEYAFYVDGQLIDQRTDPVQLNSFSGTYMSIGAETNGFTEAEAAFDEFRVSTRARSAAEILQSYNSGLGIDLPPPSSQAAVALNHAVELSWSEVSDPTTIFDHYSVYRSTSPFSTVAGMIPIATVANRTTTSYADATAENGMAYYYAVTSVSNSASEVTDVTSIGPRTPRDETDLQVVSIARSPEFSRYNPQYTTYEITEPSGYGPYYFGASTGLGAGQTFSDPRFPELNEVVTYTATVRNRGTNLFGGSLSATWTLDGNVVESPVQIVSMDPGDTVTYQYALPWDFDPHELEFTINVSDSRAANNSLMSDPLAVPFLTYIDRSFVEQFREVYTTDPATQNDDIIDWLNEHMQRFNELFAAAGTQKRVHYGVLEVIDDNTPDPAIDYSPYAIFPLRYHDDEGNPRLSGYYHADEDIDYGLLHEMGHQLGLIDLYQLNVSPEMNLASGQAYQTLDDLMMNVSPFLTDATAPAMEGWLREAHGYFGQYMYNLPENMQLRILGYDGQPLEGATVKVYQLAERPGVGKVISDQIKFQGTTDAAGLFTLPNVPINPALVPPIGTGDVLHDNPFGYLDVVGRNGVFHIQIEYNGFVDYAWLDVAEANIAYWDGQTDLAVFDRDVSLGGPVQTVPPPDMTELNAADWEAWAQGASGTVTDDASRKLVGQSSLKFVTDGGFDTFVRYPGNINARWDLEESEFLNISFHAENPSPFGFQSGSPWIRLYDANGDYFQFQFYENGNIRDLLNDARNTWVSYQVPLDADASVQNGWRGTTYGTPDRAAISALEIHADTWGSGFTLWVDGVSFAPPPALTGDYNGDGSANAADYTVWRDTLGSTTDLRANGDDANSVIDAADYGVWTANFGETFGAGASSEERGASASLAGDLQSPERGMDTPVRPSIRRALLGGQGCPPHVGARMLALLELLDTQPAREDQSEFDALSADREPSEETEREAAFAGLGEEFIPNLEAAG